jgi:DNA-binding LacI/PurR family transcriptional regulator
MPRRSQADLHPDAPGANLETIAQTLGVAISTVSRALRNNPGIHPNTRLRIQTEAARLGYAMKRRAGDREPDSAVRHLLTLAQTISHNSQQGYLAGISRAAQAHDIGVFSHHCAAANTLDILDPARQPSALRLPDLSGIILIHRWPDKVVAYLTSKYPVVSIIHRYPGYPVDVVGLDDEANMQLLVSHLKEQGHERIGFFGYESSFSWARSRLAAFISVSASHGIAYEPANLIPVSVEAAASYDAPDCSASLPLVRARIKAGVTAWVGSSHVLAQGLCLTLRAAGYNLPGDVAVTGYHGGARGSSPGIQHPTSVEVDDEALGGAAVHLLEHRLLRSVPAPCSLLLPGHLVIGETTTKPKAKRK